MLTGTLVGLLAVAGGVFAQGYVLEPSNDAWAPRPADARRLAADRGSTVAVPFPILYFGEPLDQLGVSPHGWASARSVAEPAADDGAQRDGVLAAWGRDTPTAAVWTWEDGDAGERRLVVEWQRDADGVTARLELLEDGDRIRLAYRAGANAAGAVPTPGVARLDEPLGDRALQPLRSDADAFPESTLFTPRTALFNAEGIGRDGAAVSWQDVRKESTVPDGCSKRCTYLARGHGYLHVPDRALFRWTERGLRKSPAEVSERLLEEDRATFGGPGDTVRWVRQVLDGKVILVPAEAGEPVRVWFRIVEYFQLDNRGTSGADRHVWNLRWMLSNAFPGDDPREEIDRYQAWRAVARARLTVGKLFKADQTGDAGRQYDSGRKQEYVLWSGRLRALMRGVVAPTATPGNGWVRFVLMEDDMRVTQHADSGDVRFVPDPAYVDGRYEYVIEALDNPYGWVTGRGVPAPPLRDEGLDHDPRWTEAWAETPR